MITNGLDIAIACACNDERTLRTNLAASPDLRAASREIDFIIEFGHETAGSAYNAALARISKGIAIFAHQDVYLPIGWLDRLYAGVSWLESRSKRWGVLGVWGIRADSRMAGRVWCSGGNREHRSPVLEPTEVASIDEIVIVLNVKHGLRFDNDLPGFHLYATDIILQARQQGLMSYVIDAPVVHNSRDNPQVFDRHFFAAYRYMQRKWRQHLPLPTCTVPVTGTGIPLYRAWLRNEVDRHRTMRGGLGRHKNPQVIAATLGYE